MKITVGRLKTIIQEELNELKLKRGESSYKRDEGEESPKEELGSEAHACVAEQTDIILGDLKQILEDWSAAAPEDSDEELFRVYAQDIQKLVDKYEGAEPEAPEEHTEEECEEVHPDQSHEEWEAEEEEEPSEEEEEGEKKKEHDKGFMPGHAHSKSIGSESKPKKKKGGKGGSNFPYESKKLEQMIYQKLITALGE